MVELLDVEVSRDWKQVVLEEVCKTTSGGTPSRSRADYYDGRIPWVKSGELKDCFIFGTEEAISEEAIQKSSAKVFPKDTLLIALYGATVGKLGILKIDAATNQAVCAIFPNEEVDRSYLYFYLLSQRENLIDAGTGGAQPNISQEIIRGLKIPLPPIAEQKRIASIAQKCDRLRRTRRYTQQLSDSYLRSVFLEMFGDPLTNSRGWEIEAIEEIADVQGGLQLSQKREKYELKLPYLRVANVYRNYLDLSEIKKIGLTKNEFERVKLARKDILIIEGHGNANEIGRCAVWNGSIENCVHQNHLIRVRANPNSVNSTYLSYYINSSGGQRYFQNASNTTSGLNTISTGIVKECGVPLPPLPLQEKFARIVQRFERLRLQQRESDRQAEHLFQTVLHRAFRGKL